jgi:hypothetical protein
MADEAYQKIMRKADYKIPLNRDVFAFYTDWHHEAVRDLMDAAILTAQWGNAQQIEMFGDVLCRLSIMPLKEGTIGRVGSERLHGIGAQLLFNAIGMACVKYEKFGALEKILSMTIPAPNFRSYSYREPLMQVLGEQYWDNSTLNQLFSPNQYYPWTMWLMENVVPHFEPIVVAESDLKSLYYIWERLKSLIFGYKWGNKYERQYFTTGFFLRYEIMQKFNIGSDEPYTAFYEAADRLQDQWPPIKQGMFGGSYVQYHEIVAKAEEFYKGVVRW